MNYKEKKEEMMKKYEGILAEISKANNVDMSVAFDMLVANLTRDAKYSYLNEEEFRKDYAELKSLVVEED